MYSLVHSFNLDFPHSSYLTVVLCACASQKSNNILRKHNTMATPIRENCLDANDQPNENSHRVQAALDVKGCMCINRPGGRCKAAVVFDASQPFITCVIINSYLSRHLSNSH